METVWRRCSVVVAGTTAVSSSVAVATATEPAVIADDRSTAGTRVNHVLASVDHARDPRTQTQPACTKHALTTTTTTTVLRPFVRDPGESVPEG